MADIAEIGFKADTRDLENARKKLEDLKPAAASAEAASNKLSSELKNTNGAFDSMASGAGGASRSMALVKIAAGGIVGAFAAVSAAVKSTFDDMVKLDQLARVTGASLESLQKSRYAAASAGVGGADFNSGINKLGEQANESFRTGEGKLKELFEANNMAITNQAGKLKDVNTLLQDASVLVQNAKTEFDKIEIAKILGLSEDWVRALENGPVWLRAAGDEATKAGAVIDSEMIKKAAEFDKSWTAAASKFEITMKGAIATVGDALMNLLSEQSAIGNKLTGFFVGDKLKRGENLLDDEVMYLRRMGTKVQEGSLAAKYLEDDMKKRQASFRQSELMSQNDNNKSGLDIAVRPRKITGGTTIPTGGGGGKGGGSADTEKELTDLQKIAEAYKTMSEPFNQATTAFNAAKSALDNGLINNEAYAASIGKIKDAFIAAGGSSEQFAKIASKGTTDLGKQLQDLNEKSLKRVGDEFVEMAFKGKFNFGDLAKSIVKDLVKIMVQAMIVKPFLGLFGGFKFGTGGAFAAGARYFASGSAFTNTVVSTPTAFAYGGSNLGIMGEKDPEAIMPLKRGSDGSLGVQMHGQSARPVAANNNVNVTNQFTIAGAVSREEIVASIKASAEQTLEETKKRLVGHLDQYNRDGYL